MENKNKEMSYKQTKIEVGRLILKCLQAAEFQKKRIELNKLKAQIELDYGIGQLAVKRIIDNLETLGLIAMDGNTIKIKPKKASNGA